MDNKRVVKIKNDLLKDWIEILREYARNELSLSVPLGLGDVDLWLATRMGRIPAIRPRTIHYADGFEIPEAEKNGWQLLKSKIESGADLMPHLSRGILNIDAIDPMNTHWDINHFHLGTEPDPVHTGLIKGGSNILYANLSGNNFLAIAIAPHGRWNDIEIIKKIAEKWPDHPNIQRGMTITNPGTNDENWRLRKQQINVPTVLDDGGLWIGGFMSMSGSDGLAQSKALHWRRIIMRIQREIQKDFSAFFVKADDLHCDEVEAKLIMTTDKRLAVHVPSINNTCVFEDIHTVPEIIEQWRAN